MQKETHQTATQQDPLADLLREQEDRRREILASNLSSEEKDNRMWALKRDPYEA